jgi:hypothetical protein
MSSPLTVKRNDYHKNKKNSTVYTPVGVAKFLFDLLNNKKGIGRHGPCGGGGSCRPAFSTVFDPAIGTGRLTDPWHDAGRTVIGCDIERSPNIKASGMIKGRFEDCTWYEDWPKPDLVLCNSPFNGATGKRLYPEVFLEHIFKLFGQQIPVALFVPMGFRLNQRLKSKRFRWLRDCGSKITSIISLPLDVFDGVEFHSEILVFNVARLDAHYFLPEEAL